MRRVLLVGGAGYIGTVVTEKLLSEGCEVVCFDNFIYGQNQVVNGSLGRLGYSFLFGDICNPAEINKALDGISDVVILAGLVGDPITKKYPEKSGQINDSGIQNVLLACNGKNLNNVIFVSTCSNYGLQEEGVLATEGTELKPLSSYARSKVDIEKLVLASRDKVDFRATILRFATAFGLSPRMRFDLTVNQFTLELAAGKELLVFDAETWRPYCHVRDFADVIMKVFEASDDQVAFEVFNAGGDMNNFTKKGLIDLITGFLPDARVVYAKHGSDPRNYKVDFSKIQNVLGFTPKYSVEQGVQEILDAYSNQLFHDVDQTPDFYGNYKIN